jgi:integrase
MSSLFKITVVQHWIHDCWIGPDCLPCAKDALSARFVKSRRVPPGTPGAKKVKKKSGKWYGRDPKTGKPVPLSSNKVAAQQMLGEMLHKAALAKVGISDPFEAYRLRPLLEHLADYEGYLRAKGNGGKHSRNAAARMRRIIEGCRFVFIDDMALSRVQEFLASLRDASRRSPICDLAQEWYTKTELAAALGVKPHSITPLVGRWRLEACGNGKARRFPRATAEALWERLNRAPGSATINHYVRSARSFTRWLVRDRRTGDDPLAGLSGVNSTTDVRHARRPLSPQELGIVLQEVLESPREFRGLSGRDRHFLYLTACGTGFRAAELASLFPESFALDAKPSTATVPAAYTKNKRLAVQPLPDEVADALRGFLAKRPAGREIWPAGWVDDAAQMLQADLEAVGIPYSVEGPDGPLFADFHSLRHSYVAMLDRSGATLKEAMQLARHSDPKLTMARYGRAQLHDLGEAVRRLPDLRNTGTPKREAARATGTDSVCTPVCTGFVQTVDTGSDHLRLVEAQTAGGEENNTGRNSLIPLGVAADCDPVRPDEGSAPCRNRTDNLLIKSQLLYRLS